MTQPNRFAFVGEVRMNAAKLSIFLVGPRR